MPEIDSVPLQNQARRQAPEIVLTVELGVPLEQVVSTQVVEQMREAVVRAMADLLTTMGVPGQPTVRIAAQSAEIARPLPPTRQTGDKLLRLRVQGYLCRYSDELLLRIYSYVAGVHLTPDVTLEVVRAWITRLIAGLEKDKAIPGAVERVAEFVCLACLEIVKCHLGALFTLAQVEAYLALLPQVDSATITPPYPDAVQLQQTFACVLEQRISLADRRMVARVLRDGTLASKSPLDIAEDLISTLKPDVMEIRLLANDLRLMTIDDRRKREDSFKMVRETLFVESGLRFPRFQLRRVDDLKPGSVNFRVNHLTTLPRIGLDFESLMVYETHDRLSLRRIDANEVLHAVNGTRVSLIKKSDLARLPEGLLFWNTLGYIILLMQAELVEQAARFVDLQHCVVEQIRRLEQSSPALVRAMRVWYSDYQFARLLRGLVAEGVSIRDLRMIGNAALDYDTIVTDHRYIALDDRLPIAEGLNAGGAADSFTLIAFVRMQLKRQLSYKHARGQTTLTVYLLDFDTEQDILDRVRRQLVAGASGSYATTLLSETEHDALLQGVRQAIGPVLPFTSSVCLLTSAEVRPFVRALLADEFPRVPVLAYQELTPETSIQVQGRIKPVND